MSTRRLTAHSSSSNERTVITYHSDRPASDLSDEELSWVEGRWTDVVGRYPNEVEGVFDYDFGEIQVIPTCHFPELNRFCCIQVSKWAVRDKLWQDAGEYANWASTNSHPQLYPSIHQLDSGSAVVFIGETGRAHRAVVIAVKKDVVYLRLIDHGGTQQADMRLGTNSRVLAMPRCLTEESPLAVWCEWEKKKRVSSHLCMDDEPVITLNILEYRNEGPRHIYTVQLDEADEHEGDGSLRGRVEQKKDSPRKSVRSARSRAEMERSRNEYKASLAAKKQEELASKSKPPKPGRSSKWVCEESDSEEEENMVKEEELRRKPVTAVRKSKWAVPSESEDDDKVEMKRPDEKQNVSTSRHHHYSSVDPVKPVGQPPQNTVHNQSHHQQPFVERSYSRADTVSRSRLSSTATTYSSSSTVPQSTAPRRPQATIRRSSSSSSGMTLKGNASSLQSSDNEEQNEEEFGEDDDHSIVSTSPPRSYQSSPGEALPISKKAPKATTGTTRNTVPSSTIPTVRYETTVPVRSATTVPVRSETTVPVRKVGHAAPPEKQRFSAPLPTVHMPSRASVLRKQLWSTTQPSSTSTALKTETATVPRAVRTTVHKDKHVSESMTSVISHASDYSAHSRYFADEDTVARSSPLATVEGAGCDILKRKLSEISLQNTRSDRFENVEFARVEGDAARMPSRHQKIQSIMDLELEAPSGETVQRFRDQGGEGGWRDDAAAMPRRGRGASLSKPARRPSPKKHPSGVVVGFGNMPTAPAPPTAGFGSGSPPTSIPRSRPVRTHAMDINTKHTLPCGTGRNPVIYTPQEPPRSHQDRPRELNGRDILSCYQDFAHKPGDTAAFLESKFADGYHEVDEQQEEGKPLVIVPDRSRSPSSSPTPSDFARRREDEERRERERKRKPEVYVPLPIQMSKEKHEEFHKKRLLALQKVKAYKKLRKHTRLSANVPYVPVGQLFSPESIDDPAYKYL